jgi:two-component system NtrC family sensor kinase
MNMALPRVLVVDDTASIHEDLTKILAPYPSDVDLSAEEAILFGIEAPAPRPAFEVDSAYQGQEALAKVIEATGRHAPYAVAIVDMRMPPGWNGVETIEHLWAADDELRVILCSAYSDLDWDDILRRLNRPEHIQRLRKPFDPDVAFNMVDSLAHKRLAPPRA